VLEGRRIYEHLTAEENLLVGSYLNNDRNDVKRRLMQVFEYFPRLRSGGFMFIVPIMKRGLLEVPLRVLKQFADVMEGRGFEYIGVVIPIESFSQAYRDTLGIGKKYRPKWLIMYRVIVRAFNDVCLLLPFNRANPEDIEMARKAFNESNFSALTNEGVIWKAGSKARR
jgi:hypothetical protein